MKIAVFELFRSDCFTLYNIVSKGECGARGLTPLTNRARINLLKAEGMVLEKGEAEEIKLIRESRQNCGCSCKGRDLFQGEQVGEGPGG